MAFEPIERKTSTAELRTRLFLSFAATIRAGTASDPISPKASQFELALIEEVVRYSQERYVDNATGRLIAISRHGRQLVMALYEAGSGTIRVVTMHAISREQIDARIKSGRFSHEC